jgi:ribosome-associated protein
MIQISPAICINENEIEAHFIRAPGPGGQKVNKTESAVQLRFNARKSLAL